MSDIFKEIIPSILDSKKPCYDDDYNPYIVNKVLGSYLDCVLYANEMNLNAHLDKDMQYEFYIHAIKPYKRRFQKWLNKSNINDVKHICSIYNVSEEKGIEILKLLSNEQISILKESVDKGGAK